MKPFLTSVAAIALMGGAALAQGIVLVPQGEGAAGQQQFILVPVPQDDGAPQGAVQQGAAQQDAGPRAAGRQARERAEEMALDLYRRGYQRGIADAASRSGAAVDPAAMEQIGRELFERGYMLGLMQARAQMTAEQMPDPGANEAAAAQGGQESPLAGATAGQQAETAGEAARDMVQAPQGGQEGESAGAATGEGGFPQAIVRTTETDEHGEYLVDANGRAVYILEEDRRGDGDAQAQSECHGECAEVWPPVLTQGTPPRAEGDADEGMLSMTERDDGTMQVTYDGWPLYYYVEDEGEARATGQDVHDEWGEWYLLRPSGEKVEEE